MQTKHSAGIAANIIYPGIEALYKLFLLCQNTFQKIETLKKDLSELDSRNSEYETIKNDKRENMKMVWNLVLIAMSFAIDFVLVYQPMEIICSTYGWPGFLKYFVPIFLITLEIGIAYNQILHQRNGETSNFVMRNLQYLVIVVLIGFSILLVVFTLQGYDSRLDGMSFLGFLTGTVLFQACLLCASIMLHLFLIKNAELLAETFGFFSYIVASNKITYKIRGLNKAHSKKTGSFKEGCRILVHKIEIFKNDHPDSNIRFENAMPQELIDAIHKVMGRRIFGLKAEVE